MNKKNDLSLGGCYHDGLVYALGYYANGEIELEDQLFTNLKRGFHGGIIAALAEHQRQFDPSRNVERFIVALKPVQILANTPDEKYDKPENNAGCGSCGENDRIEGDKFCEDCIDDDICDNCCERLDDCYCDCDEDNKEEPFHMCEDEFCEEFIADTFQPMNAFVRARWLKVKQKGN